MMHQPVNESRRFWKYMVFGILTLGIYDIWFKWTMIDDLNKACGYVEDTDEARSPIFPIYFLLGVVTFGIYYDFWYYKQGQRLRDCGKKYGLEIDEKGSTYLLWILLGIWILVGPFIATYIFVTNCNKICRCYNLKIAEELEEKIDNAIYNSGSSKPAEAIDYFNPRRQVLIADDSLTESVSSFGLIRFSKGSMNGAEIELKNGESILVGRDSGICQMILSDRDISHKHCLIRYSSSDACYYVTDYSSLGTYMNGSIRLTKNQQTRCPLGTRLTLGSGSTELQLR